MSLAEWQVVYVVDAECLGAADAGEALVQVERHRLRSPQSAVVVVAVGVIHGFGECVTGSEQRGADALPDRRLHALVGHEPERLIRVHVAGDVGVKLPAGGARARSGPVDIDALVYMDTVRAHIAHLRRQSRGKLALQEEIPGL